MSSVNDKVEETIRKFICEFIEHPYLCYTEHGQHARFYQMLYEALDPSQRYLTCMGQKVCVIQKEYPTASKLFKPQRQHWDIAIIKSPAESAPGKKSAYDYLKLEAIVEFGMNEAEEHIDDDIKRLCHVEPNAETTAAHRYIVHLYRLSDSAISTFSGRDWASDSKRILPYNDVNAVAQKIPGGKSVSIFYGMYDGKNKFEKGAWLIKDGRGPEKVTCK